MKKWDRAIPAEGIDLGVWMAAQADPEITSSGPDDLVVDFPCWEPRPRGSAVPPQRAAYSGRLRFEGVKAFRLLDGELGPYRLDYGEHDIPPCFFEVCLSSCDTSKKLTREASWYPTVRREQDSARWFAQLDAWDPEQAPPPALPGGARHFVVVGHDAYLEVLAARFAFQRVADPR